MNKLIIALILAISFSSCVQKKNVAISQPVKTSYSYNTSKIYATVQGTDIKLSLTADTLAFGNFKQPLESEVSIVVDPTKTFQTFLGIGAALTDASAETYFKLTKENQDKFMDAYYSVDKGIGYTLARTTIHSSDFSSGSYTYIDEGDTDLKTFNIDHDKKYRLPFTKLAIKAAGGKLTMYASPWSPPAFMKTNNNMLEGGKLLPAYYQPWANYFVKFIKAYEKEGVPIWGLTVQNEPMAKQTWESCIYSAEDERDFVKNNLGPTLEKEGLGDKKLIVWDHNRDLLYQRASTILNDPEAAKYVWGIGFHWYEDWRSGVPLFSAVEDVHKAYPDKNLIFTEGCNDKFDLARAESNDPILAERYGISMINDFNNGTVAWTVWNILLDETGGPNHVGNFCFSPVLGNTKTGALTFTNAYYYIGHFSKFIRPGAKRIASISNSVNLLSTAFINEDQSIVVVILNKSDNEMPYNLSLNLKNVEQMMPPHAIQTIILK